MKKTFFALMVLFLLSLAIPILAQTDYTLLQSLPLGGADDTKTDASTYIKGIFVLTIGIAGVLAVIMIIYGGIQYMSTDAISGKSNAKEIIQHAIWGLLLAISAWLILNTINPNLVNFNFTLEPIVTSAPSAPGGPAGAGGGVLPGYTLTAAQVEENAALVKYLEDNNVTVNNNGEPCTTGGTQGCTNIVGLPQSAIDAVINLAKACDCSIEITGGTEGGHLEHGPNLAVVDLAPTNSLNSFLRYPSPQNGTQVIMGTTTYTYEAAGAGGSTGDHWHVEI